MKKLSELKPEQKRILAAEACGWHEEKEPEGSANATAWWHHNDRYPSSLMPVPDYGNDLNAMHEAVMQCRESLDSYTVKLRAIVLRDTIDYAGDDIDYYHATAAQRLDAFLLAKGLAE